VALAIAEQVRAAVERGRIRRSEGSESIGGVTVSIGIACSREGEPFESLMLRADRALYQSKAGGRNRVTLDEAQAAA
jgi:diguanylate cyclase (GGDEF)-like protein